MEFEYYIKVTDRYEKRRLIIPANSDRQFFQSLLLTLEEQLEIIKHDILSFFPDKQTNISRPKHEDSEIQKKVDKLVGIRKLNIDIKDKIKELLEESEFIICECGSKMYKTPINISFKRYGNAFLFPDGKHNNIKYSYLCENCWRGLSEECYLQIRHNLDLRIKLLQQGYNWVPNEFGVWHYEGDKTANKPPELAKDDKQRLTYERVTEQFNVKGQKKPFCKVYDRCIETGDITPIIFK